MTEIAMPDVRGQHQERSVKYFTLAQNAAGTTRLRSVSRGRGWRGWNVGDNLALAARDQATHVILPQRQRVAHLTLVARPVVDARRSALVPALMVENLLDDVRLHADVGHARRHGPADVVGRPVGDAGAPIERDLAP